MKMEFGRRALDKIFKRRDRYDIPDWQRDEVWSTEKKQLLLDTILPGWKLPKFCLLKTAEQPEEFDVVDGQQRLAAIFEFMDNSFELSESTASEFGGPTYPELPDGVADAFDDYELEFDVITEADDDEVQEFFQRLQQGMPLTAPERLNSVPSKLTEFCRKLAAHSFFQDKVAIADKRKAYFDIASKVAAIEIDGVDTRLRFEELRNTFLAHEKFSSSSSVAKRLKATFDFLDKVFPEKATLLRNRSTIQSIATLTSQLIQADPGIDPDALRAFFENFAKELSRQVELGQAATDTDYLAFQRTLSANLRTGARDRNEILLRKLFAFDPSLAQALGPKGIALSGLPAHIHQSGSNIAQLVEEANELFSATEGKDLFKATNKTTAALTRLRVAIANVGDYEGFIKDLYFLFWEGSGARLDPKPEVFKDINLLRTGLEHDVDHGKPADVRKKKKLIGDTFRNYSGGTTPGSLAPELFPVLQSNLMDAVETTLDSIVDDLDTE